MIYMRHMPDGSESVELLSVPVRIREFVNSVREKDPEKCWPFVSICDYKDVNDQFGQISLSCQNAPESTADSKSDRRRKGKQVLFKTSAAKRKRKGKEAVDEDSANPAELQLVLYEGNDAPFEIEAAKDSDYDTSRTISDLPAKSMSLYHHRNEVVNKDDITRRKRKANKVNLKNSNNKKKNKKHQALKVNESPKFNEAEPSNRKGSCGPRGSKIVVGRVRRVEPLKRGPKRLKSSHNEKKDIFDEAIDGLVSLGKEMIKAVECKGLGQCGAVGGCKPSGSDSVVVRAGSVEMNGSGEMVQARELCSEHLVCMLNQNPAEFSPEIGKRFMRMI